MISNPDFWDILGLFTLAFVAVFVAAIWWKFDRKAAAPKYRDLTEYDKDNIRKRIAESLATCYPYLFDDHSIKTTEYGKVFPNGLARILVKIYHKTDRGKPDIHLYCYVKCKGDGDFTVEEIQGKEIEVYSRVE